MENWCSFTIYHSMAPSTIVGFSGTNICSPTIPTSLSHYRYSSYETRLLLTFEVRTLCGLIMPCQAMATTAGLEPTTTESKSVVLPLHYVVIFGFPFNLCIAPALVDSNDLLYVTKRYNSHYVSPLGQRLELFFNKLFSCFPLYFHLNFARGTVTI